MRNNIVIFLSLVTMIESNGLFKAELKSSKWSKVKEEFLRKSVKKRLNDVNSVIGIKISFIE